MILCDSGTARCRQLLIIIVFSALAKTIKRSSVLISIWFWVKTISKSENSNDFSKF